MIYIGSHLSAAKGYEAMGRQALKLGADTFAFFTRNPRGGSMKALNVEDMQKLQSLLKEYSFGKLVAHAPYTMNACGAKPEVREFAEKAFREDLERLEYLPGNYYNFHPGSHVGQGTETGIAKIAEILNDVLNEQQSTTVLLETMSGKGSEVGATFQELREIIDRVGKNHKLGVCLDTCHVWDGGYDIVHDLDGVLTEFDQVIGLSRLKAVHLNDSMNGLGSHKDRHAKIGEGEIGLDALVNVVCHPALKGIPFILETPNDDEGWKREIALLRERYTVKGA